MVNFKPHIVSGESWNVQVTTSADYVSAKLALRGPTRRDIDGQREGGAWVFSANSDGWIPGDYVFEIWGTYNAGMKERVCGRFCLRVQASLLDVGEDHDPRSVAQRNVEKLEAYLSSIGDPDSDQSVLRYKINNRELENYPLNEIRGLLSYWKKQYVREQRKAKGLSPIGPSIKVRI